MSSAPNLTPPVEPSHSEGAATDAGKNRHRASTGTEQLIPCPWDQEILTSTWGGSGCTLQRYAKFAEEPESGCQMELPQRSRVDYFRGMWMEMGSTFT
jgi:hypothetical protein